MQAELRKHAQAGLKLFCHDKNNYNNNNTDVDRQQQLESLFDAMDFNCSGFIEAVEVWQTHTAVSSASFALLHHIVCLIRIVGSWMPCHTLCASYAPVELHCVLTR